MNCNQYIKYRKLNQKTLRATTKKIPRVKHLIKTEGNNENIQTTQKKVKKQKKIIK